MLTPRQTKPSHCPEMMKPRLMFCQRGLLIRKLALTRTKCLADKKIAKPYMKALFILHNWSQKREGLE